MRALKDLPELKPLIESGALSVSSISKAQVYYRKVETPASTREEKLEVFQSLEGCTTKEVEKKIAELQGEAPKVKLVIELDEAMAELWEKVKNLSAHRTRGRDTEVLRVVSEEWLKRNDPLREVRARKMPGQEKWSERKTNPKEVKPEAAESNLKNQPGAEPHAEKAEPTSEIHRPASRSTWLDSENTRKNRRANARKYSAESRREVFRRAGAKCVNCGSQHALEVDHAQPVGKGGTSNPENLRILCSSCNHAAAIAQFGKMKMASFRNSARAGSSI